jgi:hypothetical protein
MSPTKPAAPGVSALRAVARSSWRCARTADERLALSQLFDRAGAGVVLEQEKEASASRHGYRRRRQQRRSQASRSMAAAGWCCPITLACPREPVLLSDGHLYEKAAIDAWLQHSMRSPLTREKLGRAPYVPWSSVEAAVRRSGLGSGQTDASRASCAS